MARRILMIGVFLLSSLLLIFSPDALAAARQGLELWWVMVLPALFPFFVCATILQKTGALDFAPRKNRLFKKLGIPAHVLPMMALSAVSGAPTGARLSALMEEEGAFTKDQGNRYAAIFNLASPMFLFGSLGAGMMNDVRAAIPIALGQYGSALILFFAASLLFRSTSREQVSQNRAKADCQNTGKIIVSALSDGVNGMLKIGASIVFFMVLIKLLEKVGILSLFTRLASPVFHALGIDPKILPAAVTGSLEMTSGCAMITKLDLPIRLKIPLCSGMVTFGGLCMLLQSLSFYELKVSRYLLLKQIQNVIAGVISYLTVPWFLPDSAMVMAPISKETFAGNLMSGTLMLGSALLGLSVAWLLATVCKKRMRNRIR